jgi:hypothetical protein
MVQPNPYNIKKYRTHHIYAVHSINGIFHSFYNSRSVNFLYWRNINENRYGFYLFKLYKSIK